MVVITLQDYFNIKNGYWFDTHHNLSRVKLFRPVEYNEIGAWIEEHFKDEWKYVDHTGWRPVNTEVSASGRRDFGDTDFFFTTDEAAMAFILRWL